MIKYRQDFFYVSNKLNALKANNQDRAEYEKMTGEKTSGFSHIFPTPEIEWDKVSGEFNILCFGNKSASGEITCHRLWGKKIS